MKVVEKFVSINGEGTRAGELAVFIRFRGCNLRCSYCDTMWANEPQCAYEEMTPEEIVDYIRKTGITNVTLTGGEPLLQKEMPELLELLQKEDTLRVEIETNGAVELSLFCEEGRESGKRQGRVAFTMDYKLPSSGCESDMKLDNFAYLTAQDTVKFVIGSRQDLQRAEYIIGQYDLTSRCHVYFSPVFGAIEPVEIVDYMISHHLNEVRMQIQMHKVIWDPDKRGV